MNALIEANRDALNQLCRRYQVRRLELFGSAVAERFEHHRSDLDFLVDFESLPPGKHARAYFGLLESLEELFQRPIDLVEARAIRNPYFKSSVEQTRVLLYAP